MLYREIIAVCTQIHTKHTNSLCGQNVEILALNLVVHFVTIGLKYCRCLFVPLCIVNNQSNVVNEVAGILRTWLEHVDAMSA